MSSLWGHSHSNWSLNLYMIYFFAWQFIVLLMFLAVGYQYAVSTEKYSSIGCNCDQHRLTGSISFLLPPLYNITFCNQVLYFYHVQLNTKHTEEISAKKRVNTTFQEFLKITQYKISKLSLVKRVKNVYF